MFQVRSISTAAATFLLLLARSAHALNAKITDILGLADRGRLQSAFVVLQRGNWVARPEALGEHQGIN